MRKLNLIASVIAASCVFSVQAKQAEIIGLDNPYRIHNSYIVVFKDGTKQSVDDLAKSVTNPIAKSIKNVHKMSVKRKYKNAFKGISISIPDQAIQGISNNPNVAYIEADFNQPNVTSAVSSWGVDRIDQRDLPLNSSYSSSATGNGVHAYIMDSGIRSTHNEFIGRIGNGVNYSGEANGDCLGHGTHVAGTVGGSTYGVAPDVIIHDVKWITCNNSGTLSSVLSGIDWIVENHISPAVANFSWHYNSTSVSNAVIGLVNSGVTVVAAAGNSNTIACNAIPANVTQAITVGSTEIDDDRSSFSNYGTCVDIFAPGTNIRSATNTNNASSGNKSGTSMASPHVAGVVALYLEDNPSATPTQVNTAIVDNASLNKINNPGTGSPNKLLYSTLSSVTSPATPSGFKVRSAYCFGLNDVYWNSSAGSTHYELWASQSSNFSSPYIYYSGPYLSKTINTTSNKYLKVRACNNDDCSAFSPQKVASYYGNTCM